MLNGNEKAIAHIASAISIFSIRQNNNTVPKNISMVDFILKTIPEDIKPIVTAKLTFKLHGDSVYAVNVTIRNCNRYLSKFFVFKYIYIL